MMLAFKAGGHEVFAIGNEKEEIWADRFAEKGIKYFKIDVSRNGVNPVADIKTFFSVKNALKKICPDKVFAFQAKTVIYGSFASKALGIKEFYPLIAGLGSLFLRNDFKTRVIRQIMISEYRSALSGCPVVFFQNTDDEKLFRDKRIIKNEKSVILHGSGVNLDRFSVQPFPERFAFLCIARLIRDKGVCEYLEACRRIKKEFPDIRCMLLGGYDSNPSALGESDIKPYIQDGSIEFYGAAEDVRPYLAGCSVFVLPSSREGVPKTVLEAMATGRAVITTDVPGCRETVKNGENGFKVRAGDADELYAKMEYIASNRNVIHTMGIVGREMAENLFDVNKVNGRIINAMRLGRGEA